MKEGMRAFAIVVLLAMIALVVVPLAYMYHMGTMYEDGSHTILGCVAPWLGCTQTLTEFGLMVVTGIYLVFMLAMIAYSAIKEV